MMMNGLWVDEIERLFERQQQFVQGVGERLLDAFRRVELVALGGAFSSSSRWLRRFHADIAGQQQGFELLKQLVVDLAARENRLELAANWARVRASPAFRRSRQEGACVPRTGASALRVGADFFRKPNMGISCLWSVGEGTGSASR
jgi:hypothetical protein